MQKIKIHLEELTILDVKENLVNEMKGELKYLTIDNLIIPDIKNHSIKQSRIFKHLFNIIIKIISIPNF